MNSILTPCVTGGFLQSNMTVTYIVKKIIRDTNIKGGVLMEPRYMVKTKYGVSEPMSLEDANRRLSEYRQEGVVASILPEEEGLTFYFKNQGFIP